MYKMYSLLDSFAGISPYTQSTTIIPTLRIQLVHMGQGYVNNVLSVQQGRH